MPQVPELLAHRNAKAKIPDMDTGLAAGDVVKVGKTVELESLDTPGHTMSHVCLLSRTDQPAFVLRRYAVQTRVPENCHNGGHPEELYDTFVQQLAALPDDTLIYPGHDYIANNLQFTLDREPDNPPRIRTAEGSGGPRPRRRSRLHARAREGDQHLLPAA